MSTSTGKIVLGSGSPRRRELLSLLFSEVQFEVIPPRFVEEGGFEKLTHWNHIEERLAKIVNKKSENVFAQLNLNENFDVSAVLTADTVVVVPTADSEWKVLEKPPETENWKKTVRNWFRDFYSAKSHFVLTCFQISIPNGISVGRMVKSEVTFHPVPKELLEWYLATGEPLGKAGGYAIQGAGTIFIDRVQGSISNVVGLPLKEVWESFRELEINVNSLDN